MANYMDNRKAHDHGFKLAVDREVLDCYSNNKACPTWVMVVLAQRSQKLLDNKKLKQSDGQLKREMIISAALHATDGSVIEAMDLLESFYVEPKQKCDHPEEYDVNYVPTRKDKGKGDWLWTEENLRKWKSRKWSSTQPDPDALEIFEDYLAKR